MANKLTDEDREELIFEYLEDYEHYLRVLENEVYDETNYDVVPLGEEINDIHQAICAYCRQHPLGYRYLNHAHEMRTEMYIRSLLDLKERQLQDLTDSELASYGS